MENQLLLQVVDGLKELRHDVNDLKKDMTAVKDDISEMKKDISGLKEDVSGLKEDVSSLKEDVTELREGQARIEKKLDAVYKQTAELTEFRTETKSDLAEIKGTLRFVLNKSAETEKEIYLLKQSK